MAPTYRADVTVHAPAADVVGRLGDTPGDVQPVDAATCRVRSRSDTLEWLAFRLVHLELAAERGQPVWRAKKRASEQEVKQKPQRDQDRDCAPECVLCENQPKKTEGPDYLIRTGLSVRFGP